MDVRRILRRAWPLGAAMAVLAAGCHQDMWQQPKVKSQSKSDFFMDDQGTRPAIAGTVEFGKPMTDVEFYTGFDANGRLVREFPVPVTADLIKRGKERFEIFCLNCHGAVGDGQGMIAKRGFTVAQPIATYHTKRLREMPIGHFYDVITNGFGTMYPLKARIKPLDRWAVAAYVRVLQRSQDMPVSQIPDEEAAKLNALPYSPQQDAPAESRVAPSTPAVPEAAR
jgi:mono/diheme cytochrome c family protein